jgi:hypothetical protein
MTDGYKVNVPESDKNLSSSDNSTTSTLAADGTYTGTWERNDYPVVHVVSVADVTGTVFLDFSPDGGTTVITRPVLGYSAGPNIPEVILTPKLAEYFRVRYVNDGTIQSSFSLTTQYSHLGFMFPAPYNDRIGRDANSIPTRPSDPQDDISRNLRAGVTYLNKFGFRNSIDIADGDAMIIADDTTNTPTILTAASTFDIAYDGTAGGSTDGTGTTGATSLLITYLDENQKLQTATHVLGTDGTDTTSFSGLGINRAVVVASGSNNANASDITITATTGSSVQAFIPAGISVTQQVWGHIPTGSVGVAKFIFMSATKSSGGGSPELDLKIFVYNRGVDTIYEVFRYHMDTSAETSLSIVDPINFVFSAGDVFWMTASTNANNTSALGRISLNIYEID